LAICRQQRVIRGIDAPTIPKANNLDLTSDDTSSEAFSFATQADLAPYITNLNPTCAKPKPSNSNALLPSSSTPSETPEPRSSCSVSNWGIPAILMHTFTEQ